MAKRGAADGGTDVTFGTDRYGAAVGWVSRLRDWGVIV